MKVVLTRPSVPRIGPDYKGTPVEGLLLRRNLAFVRKVRSIDVPLALFSSLPRVCADAENGQAGFRRVGLSPVMAYIAADPAHPSHQLPVDSDAVSHAQYDMLMARGLTHSPGS